MSDFFEPAERPATIIRQGLFLLVVSLAAFWPSLLGAFVFDDLGYVINNPVIRSPEGLSFIWRGEGTNDYWPLSFSYFWLAWRAFGENTTGYHLVNVFLHVTACLLLARVLLQMGLRNAWLAAALFAVHPVNVETVAWIFQAKTLLSAVSAFASVSFFISAEKEKVHRARSHVIALLFFALSLLSKSQSVMLPVVLLGWSIFQFGWPRPPRLLRLTPYFALSLVFGLLTIYFQSQENPVGDLANAETLWTRILVSASAYWFYLWKALLPVNLSMVYSRWEMSWNSAVGLSALAALVMVPLALWFARSKRWVLGVLVTFAFTFLMLFPVLGIFPVSFMRYSRVADHWQYLALPAVCALLAYLLGCLRVNPKLYGSRAAHVISFALLVGYGVSSYSHSHAFKDEISLWQDTLAKNPSAAIAHFNLGVLFQARGDTPAAALHYNEALKLQPHYPKAEYNLAILLHGQGKIEEAIPHYRRVIASMPSVSVARLNYSLALESQDLFDQAIEELRTALTITPDYAEAHDVLGRLLLRTNRRDEAIKHLRLALSSPPEYFNREFAVRTHFSRQEEVHNILQSLDQKP